MWISRAFGKSIYYSIQAVRASRDISECSYGMGPLMSRECLLFPWWLVFRVAFHIKFQERWTVTRYFKFWKPVELFAALHLKTGIVCRAKLSSTVCRNIWDCVVSEAWLRFVSWALSTPSRPTPKRSTRSIRGKYNCFSLVTHKSFFGGWEMCARSKLRE